MSKRSWMKKKINRTTSPEEGDGVKGIKAKDDTPATHDQPADSPQSNDIGSGASHKSELGGAFGADEPKGYDE